MPVIDSPQNAVAPLGAGAASEPVMPQANIGSFLGSQAQTEAFTQRREMFQRQIQSLQMLAMQIAEAEPGFSEVARAIIDLSMKGMGKVVGGMHEPESGSQPYL